MFVNRVDELQTLERWWDDADGHLALAWGRRRVGKTALIEQFGRQRPTVFHTAAGRPVEQELRLFARAISTVAPDIRDFERRPLRDWDDAVDTLSRLWERDRVLVVLDEFPELMQVTPELPGILRALLDRVPPGAKLLLAGSAVRTMTAMQEARAPLYGRVDLSLQVHPFRPHEAALMLQDLPPAERAAVWTVTGGVPLYLRWWDTAANLAGNIERLFARPDGRMLLEGHLVLATEAGVGDLSTRVLRAIAAGRTKYSEINDTVRADSARALDALIELRLVERMVPVTDDPRRTRRRVYRIADNFLAFWLGVVDRYRSEIERGLGATIAPALMQALDRHAGPCWESAVREHLRRMAHEGALGEQVVAVGPWWRDTPEPVEIDALVLATEQRRPVVAAEAKWASTVDGARVTRQLAQKLSRVPGADAHVRLAVAARERVVDAPAATLTITADDVFT